MDREPTYGEIVRAMPADPVLRRRAQADAWAREVSDAAPAGQVHLHYHEAPAVPAVRAEPGWDLLHRLVPYFLAAALVAFIVGGSIAILAYAFAMVMGMLVVLIHSLVALVFSAVACIAVVAVLAGIVRPLFTGPSVNTTNHVTGNKNRIGGE